MNERSAKRPVRNSPSDAASRASRHEPPSAPLASASGARPATRGVGWAGVVVFLLVFGAMAATAGDLGLTWDEPAYVHSAAGSQNSTPPHDRCGILRWFGELAASENLQAAWSHLTQQAILQAWDYNRFGPNFHPPLSGLLALLGYLAAESWMDEIASWRLASGAQFALAVAVLFSFLARRYGMWAGGVAAGSLVAMPRVVGDAHLFGTDVPMLAAWTLAALAFWNGLESRVFRILFGVSLGLCFLTKLSAMFVVLPLMTWLVAYRAVPAFSLRRLLTATIATALIGWPLALAGLEVVRLAGAIRDHTRQHRMLAPVVRAATGQSLAQFLGHEPPFTSEELHRGALRMLDVMARQLIGTTLEGLVGHPAPFSGVELKRAAERFPTQETRNTARGLVLEQYIAFVQVHELGVSARWPGWLLFVPAATWLVWSLVACLPFAPAWLRETGGGLQLWLAGLAIAPAVAIALNPTWWHETLPQLAHYYQIGVGRHGALPEIEIFYLGKKYIYSLPWHNGWVLTAVTVPAAILAAALVGLGSAVWNWRRDPLRVFFVLNMFTMPVVRMLPTPAHDGVRLMLPTFFFLAGLAGFAFEVVERLVERFRSEEYSTAPVLAVAAALLLGPPMYWLVRTHPYELSYYNGLVGGLAGAHRLGFEPSYWYDAVTPEVRGELNDPDRGLPDGALIALPDPKINPEVFFVLQEMGKLRPDIRFGVKDERDFPHIPLLTHSSKASPYTRLMYCLKPRAAWGHDGVRLFSLYEPRSVARAWALLLLLDATDYSGPVAKPRADRQVIELARRNELVLQAVAIRITELGLDQALEDRSDAETAIVLRRLAAHRGSLEFLLARRPAALLEAAEMINRAAADRPALLQRIIEYEGYLAAEELGEYLDAGLPD